MEKINFQDLPSTSTPLSSTNLNQMQDNMEDAIIPIKLVTISESAPGSATTGDMYYNTTDNKVYIATGTNTWDSGSTPRFDGFYVNTSNNTLFYYNGSTLIGVGGSGSGIGGDTLPVGMIMPGAFPSTMVVEDWLKCDGSAVSRTEYSELFNAIGVSYGNGDGSTTFNLPNIKGKMIIGYDPDDDDFDTIGATGGSKQHTITQNELPQFNYVQPTGTNTGHGTSNQGIPNTYTNDWASIGNNQAMNIMNPYIVMNYYIKAHQTAPVTATVKNEKTTSETDVYSCNYINSIQTLYETILDRDSNTIMINNLNIKPGATFQIVIDGTTTTSSGEVVNVGCYPNDKSTYNICRVVGSENNNGNINSVYNVNAPNMYLGRVVKGSQFIINSYCSWLGTYLKNLSSYATPGIDNIFIAGNLCSMVNLSDETLTSIRIVIASGQFIAGTKISILK